MNLRELRDFLKFVLDANPNQTNSLLSNTRLNDALNRAYRREVSYAKQHGTKKYFFNYVDVVWPSAQETFSLPASVGSQVLSIRNLTWGDKPGVRMHVGTDAGGFDIYWESVGTLRWAGNSGPGQDTTLRIYFLGDAETLISDEQIPQLIPAEMHELIAWSAAVELREILDEDSPASFRKYHKEYQIQYVKHVARGRPYGDPEIMLSLDDHERNLVD